MSDARTPATATTIGDEAAVLGEIIEEVGRVVIGQRAMIERLLMGLLAGGHVLLEGVPGLAKSLAVEALARTLDLTFRRIQFTPDLLPADITGTPIFQPSTGRFEVKKGPIFANLILADEVNRAPAKVHAALLEAMQEHKVSIGDETFPLDEPFLVLATQNPIEHEGTYPLPEAELDRFFLKIVVGYPNPDEEAEIVRRMARTEKPPMPRTVATAERIMAVRRLVDSIYVDDRLIAYAIAIVQATRTPAACGLDDLVDLIRFGGSPRASIALVLGARVHALLGGRDFAGPGDVKAVAHDVLRHRVLLSYEAEAEGVAADTLIERVLDRVEIP